MKGIEHRIERGEDPKVESVASIFVSRWDVAVADKVPAELKDRLGVAASIRGYVAYRRLLASERWQRLENEGARPQRLLFASTGTKDPDLPTTKYVDELAAPNTVNTMPEETLLAYAEEGVLRGLAAGGRRRQRVAAGRVHGGRNRSRRPRPAAPDGGRQEVRGLLERPARLHRRQGERGRGGRLRWPSSARPRNRG